MPICIYLNYEVLASNQIQIVVSSFSLKYFLMLFFFIFTNFIIKTLTLGEVCVILQTSGKVGEIVRVFYEIIPINYEYTKSVTVAIGSFL